MEKSFRVSIELDVLPKFNVEGSNYHGGKMEGPAIRNLLSKGDKIFSSISDFIISKLPSEDTRDANNVASNIEIQEVCQQYGSLCIILDSVISYIYNINDIFTDDQIEELETRLFRLLKDWKKLLLSFTPKMHVLLDHMTDQVKYIKGFTTMGEDRLEHSHQWRFKVAMCLLRVRDEVKKMNIQAKQQHRQNMKEVQDIQQKVNVASTRKNKKSNLKVEKDMIKKKSREDKRDEKINESLDHIIIKDSRESIKDKIRNTNHNGRSDRN